MRWPFWKRQTQPVTVAPALEPPSLRPAPARPRGGLGGAWRPEAPAEWPEADMADFDRENREHHERARANRARAGWEPRGLLGGANVFPRVGARKRDLVALAEAVEAWRARHAGDVVRISGLDRLREGCYPGMEIFMGCMNDRTRDAPGWEICPVQIATQGALFDLTPLFDSLMDELPAELYSDIGALMPD